MMGYQLSDPSPGWACCIVMACGIGGGIIMAVIICVIVRFL